MTQRPQLYLVDGMALLFRSFYAMGRVKMNAPDGTPTGAVYGFLKIMFKILKERAPTHFAVCWDRKEKTFRHDLFPEYKSNRSAPPPDIIPQIHLIKDIIPEFGIPSISLAGFEGDDVICTLAKSFAPQGDVYIITSDKDFMQIVDDRVKLFSLKSGDDYEILGPQHVRDYFGVVPDHVVDVLALRGDAVDFVPGVKGIGEKGAAKLISEYGSLDNLYANLDKVANKRMKELLEAGKDKAYLSKQLVTICCECPIDLTPENYQFDWSRLVGNAKVRERLEELKMASLVKNLYGNETKIAPKAAPASNQNLFGEDLDAKEKVEHAPTSQQWGKRDYRCIRTESELIALLDRITSSATEHFAFDTETTGLDFIEDKPIGMSFSFAPGEAFYLPLHEAHLQVSEKHARAEFSAGSAIEKMGRALQSRKATLVAHNLKFDWHQLHNIGLEIGTAPYACSMVAGWLLDSVGGSYGLDGQTLKHLQLQKIPTSQLIGKAAGRQSMVEVPLELITDYAAEDADATLRLWELFKKDITGSNLNWLFWELEMPLLAVLVDMERSGVHVDKAYLEKLNLELQGRIMEIENQIYAMAGQVFNIASPKQLGAILFEHLKVHEHVGFKGKLAKTTLGYKTDVGVLEQFCGHPCVSLIMEHRELSKLLNTYVFVLPQLIKKSTGRIHTCYNQIGTATGRLSSTDPNLQNIPVRTDWGKRVRAAFTAASEKEVLTSADYSQIELRVLAHLSEDPGMHAAFKSGLDIHRETAAKILGKRPDEVTAAERSSAKAINFGIIYGMGAQRLAREQDITLAQAKAFIEKYFLNFARIREYLDKQKHFAYAHGYVSTYFGRPRRIYGLSGGAHQGEVRNAENMAINSPIQGTAADIMKLGMLRIHKSLRDSGLKSKLLLQVHDEVVLEGPVEETEALHALVKDALEGAVDFSVPLLVEIGSGHNWLEAK